MGHITPNHLGEIRHVSTINLLQLVERQVKVFNISEAFKLASLQSGERIVVEIEALQLLASCQCINGQLLERTIDYWQPQQLPWHTSGTHWIFFQLCYLVPINVQDRKVPQILKNWRIKCNQTIITCI